MFSKRHNKTGIGEQNVIARFYTFLSLKWISFTPFEALVTFATYLLNESNEEESFVTIFLLQIFPFILWRHVLTKNSIWN